VRIVVNKRTPGRIEFGIIFGGIVLLALLAGRFLPVLVLAPACTFKALTGVPCPTCGSTRSIVYLSHGAFVSAFVMNPLVAACAVIATLFFIYCFLTLAFDMPRIGVALSTNEKDSLRLVIVLLLAINWLYLIITR
jgi:hypothetical protein